MKKLLAMVLCLAMVMALCSSAFAAKQEATAFKVGAHGPLTGGAAIYGNAAKNGAEIAVEEINALGGIQFELKYEDDAHDAEKALNAYYSLYDWGMQVSLGGVTTTPATNTASHYYEDRIFALTPSASGTSVIEGNDNVFQMCFLDPTQGVVSAQYVADNKVATKIGVIWKNDDVYSKGIHDNFVATATAAGLEIVSDTTFADGNDTDFSVQVADAQANGAEFLFLPMYYQPASLILAQCAKNGYAPKFFGVDGMDGILTMEGFDPALAEGVMLLTPFNANSDDEKVQSFVAKYNEKHGEDPNQFAADGYDCVYAIYQALTNAGCTYDMSNEEICDAMVAQFTSMTFDGLTGKNTTWGADGAVTKSPNVVVIQDGAYVDLK